MGYKLSTPRVGYFFHCCFIPPRRGGKREQKGDKQSPSKAGIRDSTRQ